MKEKAKASIAAVSTPPSSSDTFKPGHKQTMTPAPEPEPEAVFQPLKPARLRAPISLAPGAAAAAATIRASRSMAGLTVDVTKGTDVPALHSSDTFGRRSSSRASRGSMTLDELGPSSSGSLTPVFKRIHDSEKEKGHKRSSLITIHLNDMNIF